MPPPVKPPEKKLPPGAMTESQMQHEQRIRSLTPLQRYQTQLRLVDSLGKEYEEARKKVTQCERAREDAAANLVIYREQLDATLLKELTHDENEES